VNTQTMRSKTEWCSTVCNLQRENKTYYKSPRSW